MTSTEPSGNSSASVPRFSRAERLTAGLLLALGVGAWAYLQTGVSLLIVRQIGDSVLVVARGAEGTSRMGRTPTVVVALDTGSG